MGISQAPVPVDPLRTLVGPRIMSTSRAVLILVLFLSLDDKLSFRFRLRKTFFDDLCDGAARRRAEQMSVSGGGGDDGRGMRDGALRLVRCMNLRTLFALRQSPLRRLTVLLTILPVALIAVIWTHHLHGDAFGAGDVACKSGMLRRGSNVAVLLYAQARTLNVTHCSITRNVLAPLLAGGHKVHVFAAGEADQDSWQYEEFLKDLEVTLRVEHTLALEPPPKPPARCIDTLNKRYERRMRKYVRPGDVYAAELLSQWYFRESANNLRKRHERETARTFDSVLLIRPDVVYASRLPPMCGGAAEDDTVHVPGWLSYGGFNDRMVMGTPGDAFNHYMSLYSELCHRGLVEKLPKRTETGKPGVNAERIYSWWMKRAGGKKWRLARRGSTGGFKVSKLLLRDFVFYRARWGPFCLHHSRLSLVKNQNKCFTCYDLVSSFFSRRDTRTTLLRGEGFHWIVGIPLTCRLQWVG